MASITTNWSPSSFQLRFSFQCRKSPVVLVRTRFRKLDRQVRVFSSSDGGNGVGRRRDGNSWISSESKGDNLSGWDGSDYSEQYGKSQKKRWPAGVVGAGVAGVILVAGLSFATLSLSKRNPSRPEKQMEAMTTQMEQAILQESHSLESKAGTNAMDNSSIQEDMSDESAFDNTLVSRDAMSSSPVFLEYDSVVDPVDTDSVNYSDASLAVSSSESSQLEDNGNALKLVNSSVYNADTTNLYSDDEGGLPGSKDEEKFNFSLESSSISSPSNVDEDHYVYSDKTLNEGNLPNKSYRALYHLNTTGNQHPVSDKGYLDLDEQHKDIPNQSYAKVCDLNGSGIEDPVPDREYLDLDELHVNGSGVRVFVPDGEYPDVEELQKDEPNKSYLKSHYLNASRIQDPVSESEYLDLDELEKDVPNRSDVKLADLNASGMQDPVSDEVHLGLDELEKGIPINGSGTLLPASDWEFLNQERQQDIPNKSYKWNANHQMKLHRYGPSSESSKAESSFFSAGIPAPSAVPETLKVLPGQVLVPAVVDQIQWQALAALQVLKVIEPDVQPSDLCTRREFARWLVSASSALSRNMVSKVYPAMYIENITELAFDDITPEDPDFSYIQGLAEAGLISSKLSRRDLLSSSDEDDQSPIYFSPDSPLSRQDLVSWKMALEKRWLPETDKQVLYQVSGFIDIDNINPDAWPALVADAYSGEQGIIALAFGYTRLFQPSKPVTKAQAAIALSTGEASYVVSEELARIEAESMAEKAVAEHSALVDQVEKELNASFKKELSLERGKISAMEKLAEEALQELEKLRAERYEDNISLMKERAAVESEMEVLSRLRCEVEEQLQSLLSNKVEVSYEKERISKLLKQAESENQEIARLQYELEVERKALSMARAWAEDEAKRAREQAKALEEARDRWEKHGIKVVVENELREEASAEVTWLDTAKQVSVDGTARRAENLVDKLNAMGSELRGKSKDVIDNIVQKILHLISILRESASKAGAQVTELKDAAMAKAGGTVQELQQQTAEFGLAIKEGTKRVVGDWREGVGKITHRFKA